MRGGPEIMVSRILKLMWPFGPLRAALEERVGHGRQGPCPLGIPEL